MSKELSWKSDSTRVRWALISRWPVATVTRTGNGYRIEWQSAPVTVDTIDWMKVEDMKRYVEAQWILRREE